MADGEKRPIKIKFSYCIIGIIVILGLLCALMNYITDKRRIDDVSEPNQNLLSMLNITSDDKSVSNKNTTSNTSSLASGKNTVLDVIDKENQELKINGIKLVKELADADEQIAKEDNTSITLKLQYRKTAGSSENSVDSYLIGTSTQLEGRNVYPAFEIGVSKKTDNVVYIGVSYPYEGTEGRSYRYSAINYNYRLLKIALTNLKYVELWNTIKEIKDSENDTAKNATFFNNGLKGVYFGITDGYKRTNGTLGGEYCVYSATQNQ